MTGWANMTPHDAQRLPRLSVIEKDNHPGIVVGIASRGLFVIWQGETRASYVKFEEASGIEVKQ